MHHAPLCASVAGATDARFSDDEFTRQAIAEQTDRAKHAHVAGLVVTAVGGFLFLKLAKAFVRSVR